MNRIFKVLLCLLFAVNGAFAQDVFLSLTKTDEDIDNMPTNITVITKEEIEKKRVDTLGDLLANETGIFYGNFGKGTNASFISMRGAASSTRVLVLIDGRRVYTLDSGAANFASIPVANIEKIEIIRGSGASVYGTGAFGGIINIITKRSSFDSPLASGGLSYGSFNSYSGNISGEYYHEKFAFLISGSTTVTDGYRKNSEYKGYNTFLSGQYNINDSHNISLTANYWENKFGLPGPETKNLLPSLTAEDQNASYYAKLDYNFSNYDDYSLNINAYTSHDMYEDKPDRNGKYYYKNISDTYGLQADFHYQNILLLGAEFWQEKYQNENFNEDWITYLPVYSEYEKTQENYAVYAQLNYDIGNLRIIPGIRGNHNSKYGDIFTPSLSAIFNINDNMKISGNTGRVWRAPTFVDLYYPGWSNPDLKPEKGISSDLGIEYANNKFKAIATGYYITSKDLIVSVQNTDKARQYGIELEAGYIFNSMFQNKINYTYLNAKDITDSNNEKPLRYSPEHSINYTLTVKPIEKLNLTANLAYKSEYIGLNAETWGDIDMDGYLTFDLNANYKLNNNFSFWVKGFNLTNLDYAIIDGYPMPGATVYAGVDIKLWK